MNASLQNAIIVGLLAMLCSCENASGTSSLCSGGNMGLGSTHSPCSYDGSVGSTTGGGALGSDPDDPLAFYQWHLVNTGQSNFSGSRGVAGVDLNLKNTIAAGVLGTNIYVAVSDTGVELDHEDLAANTSLADSKDYSLAPPYFGNPMPTDFTEADVAHGTAVSGIIAATGYNDIGVRGVAPSAKIAGFKFLDSSQSTAIMLDQASGNIFSIFNYSYGGIAISPPDEIPSYIDQLKSRASSGRSGKGVLYVKAGGNSFIDIYNYDASGGDLPCFNLGSGTTAGCLFYGNSNLSSAENSSPDVLIVAAVNAIGKRASYSSPGSNLWISALGGEFGDTSPAIMTTDLQGCDRGFASTLLSPANSFERNATLNPNCKYTTVMNGTSSATPEVSGAIALLLDKNPSLTARDIKYILASTARKIDPTAGNTTHPAGLNLSGHIYQYGWQQNTAGFWFHNWYGFGLVNVDSAIALATGYVSNLNTQKRTENSDGSWIYDSGSISQAIPDHSSVGTSSTIAVAHKFVIEGVQVKFTTNHPFESDLGIELTAPSGTKSKLLNINSGIFYNSSLSYDALFLTNAFYGEDSDGNWTIKVVDGFTVDTGSLLNWKINIIGHAADETPPDGPTALTMGTASASTTTTLPASWTASDAPDILRYEYSVGTTLGGTDLQDWKSVGSALSAPATSGFTFTSGATYFLNVRMVNTSEVASDPVSDSWTIN